MPKAIYTPGSNVPTSDIPEVQDYMEALEAFAEFKAHHKKIWTELMQHVDALNQARGAADKAVRPLMVSCGPWQLREVRENVDLDKLVEAVGPTVFKKAGGVIESKPVFKLDKDRLKAAVANNVLEAETVAAVTTQTPYYNHPGDIKL